MFEFFHDTVMPAYDAIGVQVDNDIYKFKTLIQLYLNDRELTDKEKLYLSALDPATVMLDEDLENKIKYIETKIGTSDADKEEEPNEESCSQV